MQEGFPHGSDGKEPSHKAGDLGWEDSFGAEKGYPLQNPGLEHPMYCTVHRVTELDVTEQLSLSNNA